MNRLREVAEAVTSALSWLLLLAVAPVARWRRAVPETPWVISGHRGRIYEDNAGALHDYLCSHTSQPVIWVSGSAAVTASLEAAGRPPSVGAPSQPAGRSCARRSSSTRTAKTTSTQR